MISLILCNLHVKYKKSRYIGKHVHKVAIQRDCTMETNLPRNKDTLQYASLFMNKRRTPNENDKYMLMIGCWTSHYCLYLQCHVTPKYHNDGLVTQKI